MFERIRRWIRYNLMYLGHPPWDTGISPPELMTFLNRYHPGRALDVGCGTGTNLLTMAEHGWQVVGIDIGWFSVLQARTKLRKAGINGRVIYGDVTSHVIFRDEFDLVLDIGCYHSLDPKGRASYLQNLRKWLNTDGRYLLYGHLRIYYESNHGIIDEDVRALTSFLNLCWRVDSPETRPDGRSGRPAVYSPAICNN